jgi:hypothetical protein
MPADVRLTPAFGSNSNSNCCGKCGAARSPRAGPSLLDSGTRPALSHRGGPVRNDGFEGGDFVRAPGAGSSTRHSGRRSAGARQPALLRNPAHPARLGNRCPGALPPCRPLRTGFRTGLRALAPAWFVRPAQYPSFRTAVAGTRQPVAMAERRTQTEMSRPAPGDDMPGLFQGVYSYKEAARLLGVAVQRVARGSVARFSGPGDPRR